MFYIYVYMGVLVCICGGAYGSWKKALGPLHLEVLRHTVHVLLLTEHRSPGRKQQVLLATDTSFYSLMPYYYLNHIQR